MKKRLLIMMTLLVAMVTGAWAKTIYVYPKAWDMTGNKIALYSWNPSMFDDLQADNTYPGCYKIEVDNSMSIGVFVLLPETAVNSFDNKLDQALDADLEQPEGTTGDILVVRDGSIGVSAAVPEEYDGANVVSMIIVTCNDLVLPDYLCYSLNSDVGKTQFNLSKIGTALTHTSVHSVSNLLHVVPPIEEQIEIKNAIKSKLNFFDNLIRSKETIISELESYKKCLIYEYVTGKKEVGQ